MSFHLDDETIAKKDIVIVAAAGTHQIWVVCIDDVIWWKFKKYTAGTVVVIAGNGAEENRNNSYPHNAAFAQPSGLAIGSDEMFIADSESSSIRKLSLVDGKVLAVAGGDRNPRVKTIVLMCGRVVLQQFYYFRIFLHLETLTVKASQQNCNIHWECVLVRRKMLFT